MNPNEPYISLHNANERLRIWQTYDPSLATLRDGLKTPEPTLPYLQFISEDLRMFKGLGFRDAQQFQ